MNTTRWIPAPACSRIFSSETSRRGTEPHVHTYKGEGEATLRIITLMLCLAVACVVSAQSPKESPLYQEISGMDTQLFGAYNRCELDKFGKLVSDDVEFYHDKTGLSVGKTALLTALKQNICGKVTRELVPTSLEVYPLQGYGAVEIGVHRFRHTLEGGQISGEAKFIQVWQKNSDGWKLTRVISFDHQPAR